jgi:hypothetical protein
MRPREKNFPLNTAYASLGQERRNCKIVAGFRRSRAAARFSANVADGEGWAKPCTLLIESTVDEIQLAPRRW